jgi:RNA polymerase sigma-70 factor (ECF subfamily)
LKHFLANEWDRQKAVKRGGRFQFISLEAAGAEIEFQAEVQRQLTPDRLYDRRWAFALLEHTRRQLQAEYEAEGKQSLFASLNAHLSGEPEALPYAATAAKLGLNEPAVRKAVERMRRRFGRLLRESIAQTVSAAGEIDEELRHLRSLLQG